MNLFFQRVELELRFFDKTGAEISRVTQSSVDIKQELSGAGDIHEGPLASYMDIVKRKSGGKEVCRVTEKEERIFEFVDTVKYKQGGKVVTWDKKKGDGQVFIHFVNTIGTKTVQDDLAGKLKKATDFTATGAKIRGVINVNADYSFCAGGPTVDYTIDGKTLLGKFNLSLIRKSEKGVPLK